MLLNRSGAESCVECKLQKGDRHDIFWVSEDRLCFFHALPLLSTALEAIKTNGQCNKTAKVQVLLQSHLGSLRNASTCSNYHT